MSKPLPLKCPLNACEDGFQDVRIEAQDEEGKAIKVTVLQCRGCGANCGPSHRRELDELREQIKTLQNHMRQVQFSQRQL